MAEFLTPIELWSDFEPLKDNYDINVLSDKSCGEYNMREFFFNAYPSEKGVVRAFCRFYYIPDGKKRPLVMFLGSPLRSLQTHEFLLKSKREVNFFTFDYFGIVPKEHYLFEEQESRHTIYPESLAFANFYASEKVLDEVTGSPKDTAWYVWTSMARNAIAMLKQQPEVNGEKIGVIGIKTGANLAWKLAAIEPSVKCVVSLFNSGWLGYDFLYKKDRDSDTETTDERALYLAALSTQSYAPLVKAPMLVFITTNDSEKTFDRAFDTYSRIPDNIESVLTVIAHADKEVYFEYIDNINKWFDKYLLDVDYEIPKQPVLKLYPSDGKLYAELKTDKKSKSAVIYQSAILEDPSIRDWQNIKVDTIGENEYLALCDVLDEKEYFFAFAIVTHENGIITSSNLCAVIPSEIGVTSANVKASRLIYDYTMKGDSFFGYDDELFHYSKNVVMKKGALDMEGVTSLNGNLSSYKIGDPRYKGYDGDNLQMGYFCPQPQKISITLKEYKGESWGLEYSMEIDLNGNDFWDKITLHPSDFKTKEGAVLQSFENIVFIRFDFGEGFLLSNLLWV